MSVLEEVIIKDQHKTENKTAFLKGMKDCTAIAAGYFIVSFTLGIAMRTAGMTPFQGFITSLLNNASAGEYAGITMIAANASYIETAAMIFIANIRYLLMSCSLSQKLPANTSMVHRLLIGFDITDELFGIAIANNKTLNPFYYYGAMALALPAWSFGTLAGILTGRLMSQSLLSAFSAALYAMFLAIIIPEGRRNKATGIVILAGFTLSFLTDIAPLLSSIPEGIRSIVLTIFLSASAACIAPIKEDTNA